MEVIKRDGSIVPMSMDKIHRRIKDQTTGLKVDDTRIAIETVNGLYNGISSREIDELASRIAAGYTIDHPDYSLLAGRLIISRMQKITPASFRDSFMKMKNAGMLNTNYIKKVESYVKGDIEDALVYRRDFNFDYFGYKTLEKSYLARVDGILVECPQHMYMRIAISVTTNLEDAIDTYNLLSKHMYTHATPTMFNAGMVKNQFSSCYLVSNEADSLTGIMQTAMDVAQISAAGGGIGICISNVRATGSRIHGMAGNSDGIIPYLKTFNELQRWWKQGSGKRKGSFAMYLDVWHRDIFDFLEIRLNTGKEEKRARDLFTALNVPDLFMKRVEEQGEWTLFCPNEFLEATGKELWDLYGAEFEELYLSMENSPIGTKVKATDIWVKIVESQVETGTPYMLYKDSVNRKNNQANIGVVRSSNLCIEVVEVSSSDEIAVCNLASIALPKFVKKDKTINHEGLIEMTGIIVQNLNTVIDDNWYPVEKSEVSNMNHRPMGIGVQGLADVFAMLGLPFDSPEARQINKDIFESIYYGALKGSMECAKKHGKYTTYEGSPLSQGKFQFDLWGIDRATLKRDWVTLEKHIMEHGVYNSLLLALMPTASTSQIMANNECFEPFTNNVYTRDTLSGNFTILNKHLVRDLEAIGMWNSTIQTKIIENGGSIQEIEEIPENLKQIYRTVWEISQRSIIDMAADRGAFIDQTQSMNLFLKQPTLGQVTSMHFYAWKKGLKTGMYYLRSRPASEARKNLGMNFAAEKPQVSAEEAISCSLDNPEACEACGS